MLFILSALSYFFIVTCRMELYLSQWLEDQTPPILIQLHPTLTAPLAACFYSDSNKVQSLHHNKPHLHNLGQAVTFSIPNLHLPLNFIQISATINYKRGLSTALQQKPQNLNSYALILPTETPQVWDLRQGRSTMNLAAHAFEVLSADWCKYNDCVIATGSVDKTIKTCVALLDSLPVLCLARNVR